MFTFREFLLAEADKENNDSKIVKTRSAAERKQEPQLNDKAIEDVERFDSDEQSK